MNCMVLKTQKTGKEGIQWCKEVIQRKAFQTSGTDGLDLHTLDRLSIMSTPLKDTEKCSYIDLTRDLWVCLQVIHLMVGKRQSCREFIIQNPSLANTVIVQIFLPQLQNSKTKRRSKYVSPRYVFMNGERPHLFLTPVKNHKHFCHYCFGCSGLVNQPWWALYSQPGLHGLAHIRAASTTHCLFLCILCISDITCCFLQRGWR